MKTKNQKNKFINESSFHISLAVVVNKKHQDLLRVTNSQLVTLFWNLGTLLNQKSDKDKDVFRYVERDLVLRYGSYFSVKNLRKMQLFAKEFTNLSIVTLVSSIVSWEHILLLLRIQSLESKLFYIEIVAKEGLSVNQLSKKINADSLTQLVIIKTKKNKGAASEKQFNHQKILIIIQEYIAKSNNNTQWVKNIFKSTIKSSFGELMGSSKIISDLGLSNKKSKLIDKTSFEALSPLIEKFRYEQNSWLNSQLNLLFFEVGKLINDEILSRTAKVGQEIVIKDASTQLLKKYRNRNFSANQLFIMLDFYRQISDLGLALRVSSLLSWKHIILILPLKSLAAKLFYTRSVAIQKLSVASLRKLIASDSFSTTTGAKEIEESLIKKLKSNTKEVSIEKNRNGIINITTINVSNGDDLKSSLPVISVLKNPYFLDFVTAI